MNVLAELESLIGSMPPAQKADLDRLLAAEARQPWLPNPGPQTQAYLSKADLLLYGGAAGGGKTDLLIGLALTQHERTVIFRRAYVDIRGMEERLIQVRGAREGYNAADKVLRTADGRVLEFGALEKPGSEFSWQGRAHDLIGFDEGAQLSEAKVSFVLGWLRSTTPGQRTRVVIASNPPIGSEGAWLMSWFAPWLDPAFPRQAEPGELRWAVVASDGTIKWVDGPGRHEVEGVELQALSRTFIPARLDDNPYLSGTNYRASIQAMPEPLRSQLLEGDFLAGKTDHEYQVIPSAWIEAAQKRWETSRPAAHIKMASIGVDVAQGGADDTVLAPLFGTWFAELVKRRGVNTTNGPEVAALVMQHMRDRCAVNIDLTGGWGISAKDHLEAQGVTVNGVVFSAGSDRQTKDQQFKFANMRSELWWLFREALNPDSKEGVCLPPDRRLAAQLAAPTWKLRGNAILIESKDDIRDRLGSSTDDADAVILAWHKREAWVMPKLRKPDRSWVV